MIYPDFAKWQQSEAEMVRFALEAAHVRSRERLQALYEIGSGHYSASAWARIIGRRDETVLSWVHKYNERGVEGVLYRASDGRAASLSEGEQETIVQTVKTSKPSAAGLFGERWTLKKLKRWVEVKLQRKVSRSTLRTLLKQGRLSWKKCKKVLTKGKPEQRAVFMEQFQRLFDLMSQDKVRLVYLDEVHLHQDVDLGYAWSTRGEAAWRRSPCASLSARISCYGAYDFSQGRCFLWRADTCNGEHTVLFLQQLATWLKPDDRKIVLVWDGAPWHRNQVVKDTAQLLGFELLSLPAYSPDLNPIEGLWKWMREEVTQQGYFNSLQALFQACINFIQTINLSPQLMVDRLWPKFDLDPDYEKLLVST